MKKISYIIFLLLNSLNKILKFLFNKEFKYYLYDYLRQSYLKIKINEKSVFFFTPSEISKWRVETLYKKEPETLEWIDEFEIDNNLSSFIASIPYTILNFNFPFIRHPFIC